MSHPDIGLLTVMRTCSHLIWLLDTKKPCYVLVYIFQQHNMAFIQKLDIAEESFIFVNNGKSMSTTQMSL